MSKILNGKVCVITGGAKGIGFGVADCFLQHGAKAVIILDIDKDSGQKAVETLSSKHGKRISFFKCDVTQDLDEVWTKLIETYTNIDVLVNNAGCVDEQDPRKTIEVNTLAVINWSLKFWEHARTDKNGKGGTIINVSSLWGYRAEPYMPMYQASKFAVTGFTKGIGHDYNFNKFGVKVVAVCPGFTSTNLAISPKPWSCEKEMIDYVKNLPKQEIEDVANAFIEVLKRAKSGTAWLIEGAQPIVEV